MQDYKLVLRAVTPGATQLDPNTGQIVVQNASEFMSYLNEQYLGQGYEVHTVNQTQIVRGEGGVPPVYEFAYHLIKEVKVK